MQLSLQSMQPDLADLAKIISYCYSYHSYSYSYSCSYSYCTRTASAASATATATGTAADTAATTTTAAAATSYGTRLDTRGSARARHAVRVGMQLSGAVASATAPALECLRPGAPICARKPRRSPEDEKHECLGCFCDLFQVAKALFSLYGCLCDLCAKSVSLHARLTNMFANKFSFKVRSRFL